MKFELIGFHPNLNNSEKQTINFAVLELICSVIGKLRSKKPVKGISGSEIH